MKELSIEEKAKAYDEAIKRAKEINNEKKAQPFDVMLKIFPELKESEDDIRKEIIDFATKANNGVTSILANNYDFNSWLAWLEKQDKTTDVEPVFSYKNLVTKKQNAKKPTDKVEPKFKVGDIVQYITDSTDRRKIEEIDTLCNMYHTDSSPIMFEVEDEWKVVVNAEDDGDFGLPINCQIRAYRQGINDTLRLEKQGDQKPYGQREECLDCQFNYAGECKGSCAMKRCEQKPDDNVEPEFKVGDWVVTPDNQIKQIKSVSFGNYRFTDGSLYNIIDTDNKGHLWSIKDAKDGDVLIYNHQPFKWIFIFKRLYSPIIVSYYVMFTEKNKIYIDDSISTNFLSKITPATKEQRDLLFQKMKKAGYEWDAEKKELKKQEIAEIPFGAKDSELQEAFYHIPKGFYVEIDGNKVAIKKGNQKPIEWSEEDDNCLSTIIAEFSKCAGKSVSKDEWMRCNDFLNSIRDRVQLKTGWGKEDECIYQSIIDDTVQENQLDSKQINWLKSIKSRKLCVYNPYKSVVESIAKMCDKYENCMSDEKEAKDFLANVAIKCREAAEYDKQYPQ